MPDIDPKIPHEIIEKARKAWEEGYLPSVREERRFDDLSVRAANDERIKAALLAVLPDIQREAIHARELDDFTVTANELERALERAERLEADLSELRSAANLTIEVVGQYLYRTHAGAMGPERRQLAALARAAGEEEH